DSICQSNKLNTSTAKNTLNAFVEECFSIRQDISPKTVFVGQKKINGKNHRCLIGVTLRPTIPNLTYTSSYLTEYKQWRKFFCREKGIISQGIIDQCKLAEEKSYTKDPCWAPLIEEYGSTEDKERFSN
ncbi:MAG: hypothetical protein KGJ07_10210, partial [Patescibacteria group bacterium]|nr:hypothetical protein [Patescibacteria group bacterium]